MNQMPRLLGAVAAAAAMAGCAAVPGHSARTPEPSAATVAAACRYLNMQPGGGPGVPGATALRYAAAHVSPGGGGRSFAVLARTVARDEATPHTLARVARMGPDFARLMNMCSSARPPGGQR